MVSETSRFADAAFKDDTPLKTVARIQGILKAHGIETQEKWSDTGVPYCHYLRVRVFGTVFGANGKGVTREFALASAYGELMERLQLGRIFKDDQQKNGLTSDSDTTDAAMTPMQLLEQSEDRYAQFVKRLYNYTGVELSPEEMLQQYCGADGKIPVNGFYCINKDRQEYLPTVFVSNVYTTNGCAAGNTPEEALVQAISEAVERAVSNRILLEDIAVPDIGEEVLRGCPVAYETIQFLREHGFRVTVKDCSLGEKYPVVCVCLIHEGTGKYHTHFGAHPRFEIALQRTLTESFQGRNLKDVARFEGFFQKDATFDMGNLMNQLVLGSAERVPEFFMSAGQTNRIPGGFTGTDNKELLKECIDYFGGKGYDILVRDYSCLGFPTYQVIIPGYSEIFVHRMDSKQNDLRYHSYTQRVLLDPSGATVDELMGFLMNLAKVTKQQLGRMPFSKQVNLPVQLTREEESYYMDAAMASVNYRLGRKAETLRCLNRIIAEGAETDIGYAICLKRYLTLQGSGKGDQQIRAVLECFHEPGTVDGIFRAVSENRNPLDALTLHCDMRCESTCRLYGRCMKKQTEALARMIRDKQNALDCSALGKHLKEL